MKRNRRHNQGSNRSALKGIEEAIVDRDHTVARMQDDISDLQVAVGTIGSKMDSIAETMKQFVHRQDRPFNWLGLVAVIVSMIAGGFTYIQTRLDPIEEVIHSQGAAITKNRDGFDTLSKEFWASRGSLETEVKWLSKEPPKSSQDSSVEMIRMLEDYLNEERRDKAN